MPNEPKESAVLPEDESGVGGNCATISAGTVNLPAPAGTTQLNCFPRVLAGLRTSAIVEDPAIPIMLSGPEPPPVHVMVRSPRDSVFPSKEDALVQVTGSGAAILAENDPTSAPPLPLKVKSPAAKNGVIPVVW